MTSWWHELRAVRVRSMELRPGVDVGWGFVGGGSLAWQHLVSSLDVSKVVSLRNSSILFFVFCFFGASVFVSWILVCGMLVLSCLCIYLFCSILTKRLL